MTSCSQIHQPDGPYDYACEYYKPYVRYCHISALNGPANVSHFKFTPYEYFNLDMALTTCANVGGKVPSLTTELDAIWFIKAVEYLSSFVRFGWPYSYKWSSWPVRSTKRYIKIFVRANFRNISEHGRIPYCNSNF